MCGKLFPPGVILLWDTRSHGCAAASYERLSEYFRFVMTQRKATMAHSKELKLDFTLKELTLSCAAEGVDVPGSSSTVELRDNRLVCVEYPGVISSVPRMLETLGGEQAVSKVSRPTAGTSGGN